MRRDAELQHNGRAWLAWHVAALMRSRSDRRLPPLEALMGKARPARPRQTWQQQLAVMGQWQSALTRAGTGKDA